MSATAFARVFGSRAGSAPAYTAAALTPTTAAAADYERLRPLSNEVFFEAATMLSRYRSDIERRPLLKALHAALVARTASWAHVSNVAGSKELLAGVGLRSGTDERVLTDRDRVLHLWPAGEKRALIPTERRRVKVACGRFVTVGNGYGFRVYRGRWAAPGFTGGFWNYKHTRCPGCESALKADPALHERESRERRTLDQARASAHEQLAQAAAAALVDEHLADGSLRYAGQVKNLGYEAACAALSQLAADWLWREQARVVYLLLGHEQYLEQRAAGRLRRLSKPECARVFAAALNVGDWRMPSPSGAKLTRDDARAAASSELLDLLS